MNVVKLRPHHLICNFCFQGKGYNQEFITNFKLINQKLLAKSNPIATIEITQGCDDICAKCPHLHGNLCKSEDNVTKIDAAYLEILQIQYEHTITIKQLKNKIRLLLTIETFHKICGQCSWHPLNLCTPIIKKIICNPSTM